MAELYLTHTPALTIDETINSLNVDRVLLVTDSNVEKKVLPDLKDSLVVKESPHISIPPGENGKNLETVVRIWNELENIGATRRSVVLNVGGGVVTDLGGFAASTFKRGLRTVNFPTTLLGAVDAATGGKTGINFNGLKNEIGSFHLPSKVIISPMPFLTLSQEEMLSGYAEMVKTAICSDRSFFLSLMEPFEITDDEVKLGEAVEKCVRIKDTIVEQDPLEKGLRKVLNFGHTAGHAFESLRLERNLEITHGKAVAHGMLVALLLSHIKFGFPSDEVTHYANFLKAYYGYSLINCEDIEKVVDIMKSDKKNSRYGEITFTLLKEIGNPELNCLANEDEIKEAMEIYLELEG